MHHNIFLRRINAKEVLTSQKGEEFIFPIADGTAKLFGPFERLENTSKARLFRSVQWLDIILSLRRTSQGFGKTVLPGIFLGYALIDGEIWKGDILVADIE